VRTVSRPKKSLGQNFLRDDNIARKIVNAVNPRNDEIILEIGPGEGALTRFLAGRAQKLFVVEIDQRVADRLKETIGPHSVEIRHEDFLTTDLAAIAGSANARLRVVGNIPYNITTPIIFRLLEFRQVISDVTLMMQREVARRLVAIPRTKDYGILSVFCQLYANVTLLFDVSPNAFFPRPKVTSSVVRLGMLTAPRYVPADEKFFRVMVRSVFGKRRKTLRNGLRYLFEGALPFQGLPIDLNRRPEELSLEELVTLSNLLYPNYAEASLSRA
jgi:16S rRNA (adenine1518-N6/adenine1519-N6)-dimethyltransferase